MNGCSAMQAKFTEYLDGRLTGREMQDLATHLERCGECANEWSALQKTQSSLALLGPVPEPEDLLLRIRVAVSQECARKRQSPFHSWNLAWRNTVGPFLLLASAGFASAVLLMGTVIVWVTMFAQPETARANPDEPLGMATGPRFLYMSAVAGDNQIGALKQALADHLGHLFDRPTRIKTTQNHFGRMRSKERLMFCERLYGNDKVTVGV